MSAAAPRAPEPVLPSSATPAGCALQVVLSLAGLLLDSLLSVLIIEWNSRLSFVSLDAPVPPPVPPLVLYPDR